MLSIDDTDLKILAELVSNSKASFVDISHKLEIHPNVVAYRVRRMEQMGIIKRYTVLLDLERIGLSEQVYIGASFPEYVEKDDVLRQIANIPQTIRVISLLGNPALMIFLAGKNKAEVDSIISKLKGLNVKIEHTSSIIKTYQDWLLGEFLSSLAEEVQGKNKRPTPRSMP
jgi:DNA-binding Lrp family transcriptional regulator